MVDVQEDLFSVNDYKKNFVKNKKAKRDKKEERLQVQVCKYIKKQYPGVIFTCDLASGLKLPVWVGAVHKQMRSSRGLPDLFIARAGRSGEGPTLTFCNGLFVELKRADVRLKNGNISAAKKKIRKGSVVVEVDHHLEQAAALDSLRKEGYKAEFACGFDEAKKLIDEYLTGSFQQL